LILVIALALHTSLQLPSLQSLLIPHSNPPPSNHYSSLTPASLPSLLIPSLQLPPSRHYSSLSPAPLTPAPLPPITTHPSLPPITTRPSLQPLSLPSHTHIHPHYLYTHRSSHHRERFLALLALGDIPVVHPHSLPHHFVHILHVCYLLPETAGG